MNESKKNDVKRFKKEILETKYPEIIKYLQKEFEISKSSNKEFDLNREINSFTEGLLLKCFIKKVLLQRICSVAIITYRTRRKQ